MARQNASSLGKAKMLAAIREHWRGICLSRKCVSEGTILQDGHSITLAEEEMERGWRCSLIQDGNERVFQVEVLGESSLEKLKSLLDCYFRDENGAIRP